MQDNDMVLAVLYLGCLALITLYLTNTEYYFAFYYNNPYNLSEKANSKICQDLSCHWEFDMWWACFALYSK